MPIINQVVAGGGTTPTGKYQLLQRVTDDNNNEIGTIGCFIQDSNGNELAVCVLDAQYRLATGQWMSQGASVTGLSYADDQTYWESKDTATDNCDKILQCCSDNGYTSSGVSHCRSKTFVIDGQSYAGQLVTQKEINLIFIHRSEINQLDISGGQYSNLLLPSSTNMWTSNHFDSTRGSRFNVFGVMDASGKTASWFILPVLEIPNV